MAALTLMMEAYKIQKCQCPIALPIHHQASATQVIALSKPSTTDWLE